MRKSDGTEGVGAEAWAEADGYGGEVRAKAGKLHGCKGGAKAI